MCTQDALKFHGQVLTTKMASATAYHSLIIQFIDIRNEVREKQLLEKEELQEARKHQLELEDENNELREMVDALRARMKGKDANQLQGN